MKYFDMLYKKELQSIELDAPVVLKETAIIKDTVDEKILLRNIFESVSEKTVVAIAIKGKLADIFGEPIEYNESDIFEYIYQDIIFEPQTLFGNKIAIELPNNVRKATIWIDKVVLQDGTVWNTNADNIVTIQQQREIEASDEFIECLDNNSVKPIFYFAQNQSCWQCTCGQVNKVLEEYCRNCGRQKETVKIKFSRDIIRQEYDKFQRAKEEKQKEEELRKQQLEKLCETDEERDWDKTQNNAKTIQIDQAVGKEQKQSKIRKSNKVIGCICGVVAIVFIILVVTASLQNSGMKIQTDKMRQLDLIQQTKESIEPYVALIGTLAEKENVTVSESFLNNIDKVKIMGWKGTVSHGFTSDSTDRIAMMDWQSNESMSAKEYDNFTKSLNEFFEESAEVHQYDNISSENCLVWNDLTNRCWVVGWYEGGIAYLRWYGKDYWNH